MEFFIISTAQRRELRTAAVHAEFGPDADLQHDGRAQLCAHQLLHAGCLCGLHACRSVVGFWPALVLAPLVVGALGALFERYCLRRVHKFGHVPELLVTFGLSYLILELVQLVWGRIDWCLYGTARASLQGPLFTHLRHAVSASRAPS